MGDGEDEPGLSEEDIEKFQKIKEKNSEVGANEYTIVPDEDETDDQNGASDG